MGERLDNQARICVLMPAYDNAGTVADIVARILDQTSHLIAIDDGSTDTTPEILSNAGITVITHEHNKGKGAALKSGFKAAAQRGYTHVVTIDSDGQHFPEDLPRFFEAIRQHPESIIVGCRDLSAGNMPKGNRFANKFSNFWFRLQTGIRLDDTQTGYRAYPLARTKGVRIMTSRYESELELLVFSAWHSTTMVQIPVKVHYPPAGERVTHFRPFADFARISLLNTFLCIAAIIYGLPARAITGLLKR
ncbi:MAG: glycosyltransferase family 2 protein [Candidatus Cryptobacteroides sp.]